MKWERTIDPIPCDLSEDGCMDIAAMEDDLVLLCWKHYHEIKSAEVEQIADRRGPSMLDLDFTRWQRQWQGVKS